MLTLYIRLSLSEHFHHLGCTQTVGKGQDQVTPSSLLASIVAGRGAVEHRARTVLARNSKGIWCWDRGDAIVRRGELVNV
jgi:hypothetical protein